MKQTQVVLFTSGGLTGNLTLSFLNKKYTVTGVVLDGSLPGDQLKLFKRRIKRRIYNTYSCKWI